MALVILAGSLSYLAPRSYSTCTHEYARFMHGNFLPTGREFIVKSLRHVTFFFNWDNVVPSFLEGLGISWNFLEAGMKHLCSLISSCLSSAVSQSSKLLPVTNLESLYSPNVFLQGRLSQGRGQNTMWFSHMLPFMVHPRISTQAGPSTLR